jgi:hypothetical protein
MNLQFLGDAFDHWKGSVFETLQQQGVLRDFLVDPMASDAPAWKPADSKLFSRLLRIEQRQLVSHSHDLCNDRARYFAEIPPNGDLFLDPDTGVKTGAVKQIEQYLLPTELFEVMGRGENRIVVVYQHVRAKKTRERIEEVIATLNEKDGQFYCTSYESGTVAFLFLSRNGGRIGMVRDFFFQFLGAHASNRIGYWNGNAV